MSSQAQWDLRRILNVAVITVLTVPNNSESIWPFA